MTVLPVRARLKAIQQDRRFRLPACSFVARNAPPVRGVQDQFAVARQPALAILVTDAAAAPGRTGR
jgi:hypothetical protein